MDWKKGSYASVASKFCGHKLTSVASIEQLARLFCSSSVRSLYFASGAVVARVRWRRNLSCIRAMRTCIAKPSSYIIVKVRAFASFIQTTIMPSTSVRALRNASSAIRQHISANVARRCSSTYTAADEASLDSWATQLLDTPARIYTSELARDTLADLFCTLPSRSHSDAPGAPDADALQRGAPLRPLHHIAYFHPRATEDDLARDRTAERELCPPLPFGARRMWAGGAFRFPVPLGPKGSKDSLRVGEAAQASARVTKVLKKGMGAGAAAGEGGATSTSRAGVSGNTGAGVARPMVFVHQEIAYARAAAPDAPLVEEERVHVYLPNAVRTDRRIWREGECTTYHRSLNSSCLTMYAYSGGFTKAAVYILVDADTNDALPFLCCHLERSSNPSRSSLCTGGRRSSRYVIFLGCVHALSYKHILTERLVHGPLTALMLIEGLFHPSAGACSGHLTQYSYRAQNPVLVGRPQHVRGALASDGKSAVLWAEDDDGVVGMTGEVKLV